MKKAYNLINRKHLLVILLFILTGINFAYSQSGKIIINEINYRSIALQQNIDFIELYNADVVSVDLTGWQLTGGISYQLPAGTIINAGDYLVIAADPDTCQSMFGFSGALGPYTGNLSGDGEDIQLRDQTFCEIDKVDYDGWQEWPGVRFNDYTTQVYNSTTGLYDDIRTKVSTSIQKINPDLPSQHGGSWSADIPSPKAANTGVYLANMNDIPIIKSISKTPDNPVSGQDVRIKADLTNIDALSGTLSVDLEYQIVDPGSYIHKADVAYANNWTLIPMLDDGIGADSTANNDIYTAAIPANVQVHRRLIRYRVKVSTSTGYNSIYPDQNHRESNYAYYVYDGYPLVGSYDINTLTPMQEITVITGDTTANKYIGPGTGIDNTGQYTGYDYLGEGTLVYNGKVYDHVRFRPRGRTGGRAARHKPGIKFDMNAEHTFAPLDDCGNEYKEKRGKLVLSGTYVNDVTTHGLTESLIHKVLQLTGGMERGTDYTQLRIVDESAEAQDFWGVFLIVEAYDGDYLKEHDYVDGNIWRYKDYRLSHQGDFPNSGNIAQWASDMTKVDWDLLLADKIANQFLGNGANNYEGKHSQRNYYNPETGNWHIWYGDYDTTFGMSYDDGTYHPRSNSNPIQITKMVQDISSMEREYENTMRSAYDLLFNQEQADFLVDMESAKTYNPTAAYDWTTLDNYRWNQTYDLGNVDAHINWYKTWFQDRGIFLLNNASSGFKNIGIPDKPVISFTGTSALDDLTFSNSAFTDPQTTGTFTALEWRVGEWSDPANPVYQSICEPKYEIQTVWKSGEITSFSNNFTIPGTAQLEPGRTYKVRVRYKDNTNKWSHWSDAIQIVPTPANNNTAPALVINEIMYNPGEKCGSEFVEIKNTDAGTVPLDGLVFTNGIKYNFPAGTTIAPGGFIVIAKDSIAFYQKYGFYPFGDYSGSLNNNGEKIELRGLYNRLIDSLTYNSKNPWDEMPDGGNRSLELLSTTFDNAAPLNWFRSDDECGTPGSENSRICSAGAAPIVINEINYNAPNSPDAGDWVELHNTTPNAIDISDWEFYDNGNQYIIPQGTVMQPDDFLILVQNDTLFTAVFPHVTDYVSNFEFNLSGGGERISLFDENKCLSDYVVYDDDMPWDTIPDGNGPSLSLITPNSDNADPASWESSSNISSVNGTPGRPNEPCLVQEIVAPDTLCIGDPITLAPNILNNEVQYSWFLSGASTPAANTESVTVSWSGLGTYNIQLVAQYYECTKIYTRQIVIISCNTAPILTSDNYTVAEDNVLDNGFSLLSNDASDPEGDNITVSSTPISPPANGSVTLNPDGTFSYTPNQNFNGGDTFEYEVCDDGFPMACNTEMVYITVTPVNDEPTPVDDTGVVQEDASISGNLKNNDTDPDGDNFVLTSTPITQPANGSLFILSSGFYAYTPNPDFNGTDSFEYEICDDGNPVLCAIATVNITINPVNDAPTAVADALYTTTDSILIANVLTNDSDIDGDMLSANTTIVSNPVNGTVSIQANGDITYQSNSGYSGIDAFDYEVCDPSGLCSTTTVTVIIEPGCIDIQLSAWLEGPYNESIFEMDNELNSLRGILPGQTPFSYLAAPTPAGQPYNAAPWDYTGTEGAGWTDANYTGDEVDWLLVSFRTGIEKNTEIAQTAALLNKDGSIYFPDRCVLTGDVSGPLYIVIEHRNHLGIMSPTPVSMVNHVLIYDFRTGDSYKDATSYGQKQLSTGEWAMFAGDGDQSDFPSYDIQGTDKALWLNDNGVFQQYLIPDYDLNGDVNGADKVLWDVNNGISSRVPK